MSNTNLDTNNLQFALQFHQSGQLDRAERLYQTLIRNQPGNFNAMFLLGTLYAQQTKLETAAHLFGEAARIKPDFVDAHYNRGAILNLLGKHSAAIESYNNVLRLKPDHIDALLNRATSFHNLRRIQEALDEYDKLLKIKNDHAEALDNRGVALRELEQLQEALESHDRALQIQPNNPLALSNRGIVLRDMKRFEEALQSYDSAIRLEPKFGEAYFNRGIVLEKLKRFDEAARSYAHAIEIDPDIEFLRGAFLNSKIMSCDWRNYNIAVAELFERIERDERVVSPFTLVALPSPLHLQKKASEIAIDAKCRATDGLDGPTKRPPHQRIRIGYFSADFRIHAVALLIAELIEKHDRSKFEVIAFSFGEDTNDEIHKRLKVAFDKFIDIRYTSDRDVALLARSLEIDIAIDLSGFTDGARTNIFAMRAAPCQVSYLGYPGTMGAKFIDYLIADHTLIPVSDRRHYSEKIVYLPDTYQPNDRKCGILDKKFTRAELGLRDDHFVFCCFNNNFKITPDVFDIWMKILKRVNSSVLWLFEDNVIASANLRKEAAARGISPDRLVFARYMPLSEHLARHRLADLFLDTAPYNGHATASYALWAGVPLLTRIGETFAGRVAASLLNAVHLSELITNTREDYEALAIELALNPAKLAFIKQKLHENRLTTPLYDSDLLTRHIETAYTTMYERYQADVPPDHIYVQQRSVSAL